MSNEQCPASQWHSGQDQVTPDIQTPNMRTLRRRSSNRFAYKTKAHCFVRSPSKAACPQLQTINDGALLDTGLLNEARQYFESQLLILKEQLKNECSRENGSRGEQSKFSLRPTSRPRKRKSQTQVHCWGLEKVHGPLTGQKFDRPKHRNSPSSGQPTDQQNHGQYNRPSPPPSVSPLPAHQLDADWTLLHHAHLLRPWHLPPGPVCTIR